MRRATSPESGVWEALGAFLARELLVLDTSRRVDFRKQWEEVAAVESQLDDRLLVGLVGGTGVGKSTLINALAGAEISSTGDRRPTTDRVVVYRHRETPLPKILPARTLEDPGVLHDNERLEKVIVLDFPDFDSVEELHHEILREHLPHLDVLLVVVDDMKYGDFRLFELLRRIGQSEDNLYLVLNKTDRLEKRYGGAAEAVAQELAGDLMEKLHEHAGLSISREQIFAISARTALAARLSDAAGAGGSPGQFAAIVDLLEGYRAYKRRCAAKELNVEARKAALAAGVREMVLGDERRRRVERALSLLEARREELERTLRGVSPRIFTTRERSRLVSDAMRTAETTFGFPVDLLVTILRQLRPGRRPRGGAPVELAAGRIQAHYRAYLDGIANVRRELRLEVGDLVAAFEGGGEPPRVGSVRGVPPPALAAAGEELRERIRAARDVLTRRSRLRNHLGAIAVVGIFLWWILYPTVRATVEGVLGGSGVSWREVARQMIVSVVEGLNPFALVGLAACTVLAYAGTALLLWTRHVQRIEKAVGAQEDAVCERVRESGQEELRRSADALQQWLSERRELDDILSGGRAEEGS